VIRYRPFFFKVLLIQYSLFLSTGYQTSLSNCKSRKPKQNTYIVFLFNRFKGSAGTRGLIDPGSAVDRADDRGVADADEVALEVCFLDLTVLVEIDFAGRCVLEGACVATL
jgi:hypothetical protein